MRSSTRVRALRGEVVQRVIAPVEAVALTHLADAPLLLLRVGREVVQRPWVELPRTILLDRGDVVAGQQVHGRQAGLGQPPQVAHAVRVVREREVGAAVLLRHAACRRSRSRGCAARRSRRRRRGSAAASASPRAAGARASTERRRVDRERDRVRVGDDAPVDVEGVLRVAPRRLAAHAPDAVLAALASPTRSPRSSTSTVRAVGAQTASDGTPSVPHRPEPRVHGVAVEVVEHARDLHRRAVHGHAAAQDLAHRDVVRHDAAAQRPLPQFGLQGRDRRDHVDPPLGHPAGVEHRSHDVGRGR